MEQPKIDGGGLWADCEQAFDIELFEKEYFEYERNKAYQAAIEKEENDPERMAEVFESQDGCWKSSEEASAYYAEVVIQRAKQKIRELQEEIAKQEAIINVSNRTIQKYKHQVQTEKSNKRGRRARVEHREQIVRKFTMKWVTSLKDALQVKSCGAKAGLEKMVCLSTERNWRRWLNGDAIPSYATFDNLLDSKISDGKYAGEPLRNVPVTPTHNQMLTLLRFI